MDISTGALGVLVAHVFAQKLGDLDITKLGLGVAFDGLVLRKIALKPGAEEKIRALLKQSQYRDCELRRVGKIASIGDLIGYLEIDETLHFNVEDLVTFGEMCDDDHWDKK